jgi:DNA-directed RNA polymerase specialized sigma24 family protein
MRPRLAEGVVRSLMGRAPRQTADSLLEFVMGLSSADAGAVFIVREDGPALFCGSGLTQLALDWVRSSWQHAARDLAAGSIRRQDADWLVPVQHGRRLAVLLYIRAIRLDQESVIDVSGLLAEAALKGDATPERATSPVDVYLETALSEDIERRRLVLLLRRHEWNLSRVARELGITRQTVYNRMEALGIERESRAAATRPALGLLARRRG